MAQSDYWAKVTEKAEAAIESEEKKREEADEAAALSKENYFSAVDTGFAAMNQLFAENAAMQKGLAVAETVWNTSKAIMGMLFRSASYARKLCFGCCYCCYGCCTNSKYFKNKPR